MKKQLVMGMAMAVSVSFSVNAIAAGTAARSVDVRIEYNKAVEKKYELKGKTAANMSKVELKAAHERLLKDIDLGKDARGNPLTATQFSGSLSKRPTESLEILKSVAALDMMIAKGGKEASKKSLDAIAETREALLVVLLNAKKIDAFQGPSNPALMSDAQFKAATEGLNKLLAEAPKVVSEKYTSEEGAGAVKVMNALKEVLKENSSLTTQEAFVEAVMRAKFSHLDPKAARAEANKLLEKYKDCV